MHSFRGTLRTKISNLFFFLIFSVYFFFSSGIKYILLECFVILLVMQLQKSEKNCFVSAYQGYNKRQYSLATTNVRGTDLHSKIHEECWKREFHFNLKNIQNNLLFSSVHKCRLVLLPLWQKRYEKQGQRCGSAVGPSFAQSCAP